MLKEESSHWKLTELTYEFETSRLYFDNCNDEKDSTLTKSSIPEKYSLCFDNTSDEDDSKTEVSCISETFTGSVTNSKIGKMNNTLKDIEERALKDKKRVKKICKYLEERLQFLEELQKSHEEFKDKTTMEKEKNLKNSKKNKIIISGFITFIIAFVFIMSVIFIY